ncbi:MAG: hypothetical protein KIT84_28780 [Labilithrix sp.]|nr:hypothetical protein [Labilithrix sp.]MCW5815056.1 hypothetical protein [Labilithrix sp.]
MSPRRAAACAVGAALAVAALWFVARARPAPPLPLRESTIAVRVTRHDAYGAPGTPVAIRDRAQVRALVDALGADTQPPLACPADYATAEIGLLLTGADVYARRNVYVWSLAHEPHVVIVETSGCRGGPAADATALRDALVTHDAAR